MVNTTLFCKILKKIAIYFGKQKKSDRIQNTKNNQSNKRKTMISLLKITAFTSLATVLFSGCLAKDPRLETIEKEGIIIPNEAVVSENSKVKLYYKNLNSELINENLQDIAKELNSKESFLPDYWCEAKEDLSAVCTKNIEKHKMRGIRFRVLEESNSIIGDKNYETPQEAYSDFYFLKQYMYEITNKNPELRDRFGASGILSPNNKELSNKKLSFTTAREAGDRAIREDIEKQIKAGGWKMVGSKEEADKIVVFSFTRGYSGYEIKETRKNKKILDSTMTLEVVLPDMKKANHTYSVISRYFDDESVGNVHTRGNTNSTNAGVATGGAFIALDFILSAGSKRSTISNKEYLFPMFLVEDKAKNKIELFEFNSGMLPGSNKGKEALLKRISYGLNQQPESNFRKVEIK